MTASAVSTAPSAAETLLQSVNGRASPGYRSRIKTDDENHSQSEEAAHSSKQMEMDASGKQVDKAEKISKRKNGKDKSDDDESFGDTFASIGQDQAKDAAAKTNATAICAPELALSNLAATGTPDANADLPRSSSESAPSAMRPVALLQQKNILAILDAKDRLLANAEGSKLESPTVGDGQTAFQSDMTEIVPMALNRRETHWNFNSDAMASAASKLSSLQTPTGETSKAALMQSAAPGLKEQASDAKSANSASQPTTSPSVVMADGDQMANPSFANGGDGNQGDAQTHGQSIAPEPLERKAPKADASSALDKIFAPTTNDQQGTSPATAQVRDGVIDSLTKGDVDRSAGASAVGLPTRAANPPVLRTLDLTLSPADLGSVRLRMSLSSNTLSIEAEASKASTAKLLNDDRQNLERGLKDAGYDISSMKITDTSASNSANSNGWQANGSPQRDGDQARAGFTGGGQGGEMQRRDGSPSDQAQRRPREPNQQAQSADGAVGRLGNAVYI